MIGSFLGVTVRSVYRLKYITTGEGRVGFTNAEYLY